MAAYGSQIAQGSPRRRRSTSSPDPREHAGPGRERADALQTFIGGKGDVLLSYENEAIGAIDAGEEVEYTSPTRRS